MQFTDRLTIDRSHRSQDGYLRVVAKAARSGVQQYRGREVDPDGEHFTADQVVNVYRPPEEVFDQASMASFIGRPITDGHPNVPVTAKNWRDHSRGVIGGAVKDGEWIRFDLALMDADLIGKVEGGKRELSNGYACDIAFEDGTAPDGTAYQAVQRAIRGNHVAVVDQARAGPDARISDGGNKLFECCDAATVILDALREPKPMPKKITLDGLQVDLSDESAVETAIAKLQGQVGTLTTAKDAAETLVAEHVVTIASRDAEIVTLKQAVTDAKVTPAQLRDAGKAYDKLVADAKRLAPTLEITDAMDEPAIRKAAVSAKLGDAAAAFTDAQIETAFATSVAILGDAGDQRADPIRTPVVVGDGRKAVASTRSAWLANKQSAYRGKAA